MAPSHYDVAGDELVPDVGNPHPKKTIPEMTVPQWHGLLTCQLILQWKTQTPATAAKTATRWLQRNVLAKYYHRKNYNRRMKNILRQYPFTLFSGEN